MNTIQISNDRYVIYKYKKLDPIGADYIMGPISLTKHKRGDTTIYIFGELHVKFNPENFNCESKSITIEDFLANLADTTYLPIDFYIESRFNIGKYEGEKNRQLLLDFQEAEIPFVDKTEYSLYNIKKKFYNCLRLKNKECPFLVRTHAVDVRAPYSGLPFACDHFFIDNLYGKKLVTYMIGELKKIGQPNTVFPKILKQIERVKDVEIKTLLMKEYDSVVNFYTKRFAGKFTDEEKALLPRQHCKQVYNLNGHYEIFTDLKLTYFRNPTRENFNNIIRESIDIYTIIKQSNDSERMIHILETMKAIIEPTHSNLARVSSSAFVDIISGLSLKIEEANTLLNSYGSQYFYLYLIASCFIINNNYIRYARDIEQDKLDILKEPENLISLLLKISKFVMETETNKVYYPVRDIIKKIGLLNAKMLDIYTLGRMFKCFDREEKETCQDYPKNIIFYGGNAHSEELRRILTRFGFSTRHYSSSKSLHVNRKRSLTDKLEPGCIDISNIKFYHNMFDPDKNL